MELALNASVCSDLSFDYVAENGNRSRRTIRPRYLAETDHSGKTSVVGFCRLRSEERRFRLDRMFNISRCGPDGNDSDRNTTDQRVFADGTDLAHLLWDHEMKLVRRGPSLIRVIPKIGNESRAISDDVAGIVSDILVPRMRMFENMGPWAGVFVCDDHTPLARRSPVMSSWAYRELESASHHARLDFHAGIRRAASLFEDVRMAHGKAFIGIVMRWERMKWSHGVMTHDSVRSPASHSQNATALRDRSLGSRVPVSISW